LFQIETKTAGHRNGRRDERPGQRIDRQRELLERDGAEEWQAVGQTKETCRVKRSAIDRHENLDRTPCVLAPIGELDRDAPLRTQAEGFEHGARETRIHRTGVHETFDFGAACVASRIGDTYGVRERAHHEKSSADYSRTIARAPPKPSAGLGIAPEFRELMAQAPKRWGTRSGAWVSSR
jgi:hypothetical protein